MLILSRNRGKGLAAITVAFLIAHRPAPAQPQSGDDTRIVEQVRSHIEQVWKRELDAPDFGGDKQWLNVARPLSLKKELAGKVVLIDFWTYCCINCMHVLPDLDFLERKYAKDPFVVVGCHSAKFTNEAEAANVRQAVLRHDIAHPVVVDEELQIWQGYGVSSWPTLVLVGADGRILAQVSGEGQRDILDALVGQALAFYREKPGTLSDRPVLLRREALLHLARELSFPGKLILDPEGKHLYISDSNHDRIVVVALEEGGAVGRFVRAIGSARTGFRDGPAAEACFRRPQGLAFAGGKLLVADTENHAIREVDVASGAVHTVAGDGKQGHDRRGAFAALSVSLNSPWDLLARGAEVLVAMAGPHQIWKLELEKGRIAPFAGDGSERKLDGALDACAFAQPSGLAEKEGVVYVADSESSAVRAIDIKTGSVSTLAGGTRDPRNLFHFGDEDGTGLGRRLQHPLGVAVAAGTLHVADTYNHKLKTVDTATGEVKTLAGTGRPGAADGPFESASFNEPAGIAAASGKLYVADTNNHRIRIVDVARRQVSTLRLVGVPIPMAAAAREGVVEAGSGPLPEIAGTVRFPTLEVALAPGKATLRLRLRLGEGMKLAPGAPSQFRVLALEGNVKPGVEGGRLDGTEASVPLKVEGPGKLAVQVLYYHCKGEETCSVRSARWEVAVKAVADGKSEVVVEDEEGAGK